MSFASTAPVTEPCASSTILALQEAITEVLLALSPHETIWFLWQMLGLYICLLFAWRVDQLLENMIDQYVSFFMELCEVGYLQNLQLYRIYSYCPPRNAVARRAL